MLVYLHGIELFIKQISLSFYRNYHYLHLANTISFVKALYPVFNINFCGGNRGISGIGRCRRFYSPF